MTNHPNTYLHVTFEVFYISYIYIGTLTLFCSFYQLEVIFWGCGSGWSTWYTWYTCTGILGTPGDGLDGFSRPKNPTIS